MKNFLKLSLFALVFFMGTEAFAASFDPQPMGSHGFTTINSCEHAGCANVMNSISYTSLNNNKEFTVFINFRNQGPNTIQQAVGHISYPVSGSGSSATFQGRLSASNASQITDTAFLTNLPNSWQIQYLGGEVYVEDRIGSQGTWCSSLPGLGHIPWENNVSNPGNAYIGNLSYSPHQGWCEQGYIEAHFRVVDTSPQQVNGSCVAYPGTYPTQPANNTATGCTAGTFNDISDTPSEWRWQCLGSNGGTTATCTAARTQQQQPIHGMCGSAHQQTYVNPPTQGLCSSGMATQVQTNQNTFDWQCLGQNGGDNVSCFAFRQQGQQYTYTWVLGDWQPNPCTPGQTQTRTVQCMRSDGQVVNDSFCTQPKPPVQQQCPLQNNLTVATHPATNVYTNGARLNGEVTSGVANQRYFVWGTNQNALTCGAGGIPGPNIAFATSNGSNFYADLSALIPNTTYHFQACAQNLSGPIASGMVRQFQTTSGQNQIYPDAHTNSATNVSQSSATLRGEVAMNDFDNGMVFFVWGTSQSQVNSASNYSNYSSIPTSGQGIQKQVVQSGFNGSSSFNLPVSGLNTDQTYRFRICVEFYAGGSQLRCGQPLNFATTSGGGSQNVEIRTELPQSVTQTTANLCATLLQDGGSAQQTWIEFRTQSGSGGFISTPVHQRNAGYFCQGVSNLAPSTDYIYRACTPYGCANNRTFRTLGSIETGIPPVIITNDPSNITSNNATLSGTYVTNANSGTCWFEYGRTAGLGNQTRTYSVGAGYGTCVHNFTNLASGTQYCVRAVINTVNGTDRGAIKCFNTPQIVSIPGTPQPQPPIIIVEQDTTNIDLASLGLGLSLIRLDIDDQHDIVFRNSQVTYTVRWENISMIDLDDIDIKVSIPSEIQVTNISRGRFDPVQNAVFYNIRELDAGEWGEMFVSGVVGRGTVGAILVAEAEAAYDNPVNRAQENAKDFDINEYGVQLAGVTASVFGLGNVTFLGWLVILLGLFIIFLVARYLYLEREELRAQSYAHGYGRTPYAPPADDYYEPYRPNRN